MEALVDICGGVWRWILLVKGSRCGRVTFPSRKERTERFLNKSVRGDPRVVPTSYDASSTRHATPRLSLVFLSVFSPPNSSRARSLRSLGRLTLMKRPVNSRRRGIPSSLAHADETP